MFSKQDYLGYFDLIRATETKMRDNAELLLKKITDKESDLKLSHLRNDEIKHIKIAKEMYDMFDKRAEK